MSQLTNITPLQDFDFIVAITRGGLIPAFLIARLTNIRNVDTFICQSYEDDHTKVDLSYFPKNTEQTGHSGYDRRAVHLPGALRQKL